MSHYNTVVLKVLYVIIYYIIVYYCTVWNIIICHSMVCYSKSFVVIVAPQFAIEHYVGVIFIYLALGIT